MNDRIGIVGTGSYLPERVLTNLDLEKMLETSDEWIYTRTGIRERRIAEKDVCTSDLAREASLKALEMAQMDAHEIELIVMGTITPDTHCPSGANWLQARLAADKAVAFDVTAACSGFIFALSVAEQYLKTGTYNNALVVASEVMSRTVNWEDRDSCILWGDGAGAAVLAKGDDGATLMSSHLHSDGATADGQKLLMPGGGSKTTPISYESVDKRLHYLKLREASSTLKLAVHRFSDGCLEAVGSNGLDISQVDVIIPHQANIRIMRGMAKRLNVPVDKVYVTIHKYGNISGATVPIALDEAVRDGTVRKGSLVLLTAFGGGITWASSLIRW
ncbi:MAG: beta-ketoacyl-ACP synthase III [Gemmatimonadales bacterium]|jgi:3-oxoacyl-[acyl-carrier-protein] synthase-3